MTVYVYKLRDLSRFAIRGVYRPPWFGLTADTPDELHRCAKKIGLPRSLYRPATAAAPQHVPGVGHYDLSQAEHNRAVANGAQLITVRKLRKLYPAVKRRS
jgi:hypothetical protein